jgi:hypothetical protein
MSFLNILIFMILSTAAGKTVSQPAAKATAPVGKKKAWITLFDGKSLQGWHGYNKTGPVKNWVIEDGALVCLGATKGISGGDLVTDRTFANFELTWEWKIDKGSNSGVFYHVVKFLKHNIQ